MRVSVALCTHNGERFVGEQVASILEQSSTVHEIVVGDDASTDATVEIIERAVLALGDSGPSLRVLRNRPALGVMRNFEATLAACTGDIVLLSDQDDLWHPDRVSRSLAAFADRPGLTLVHADARLIDGAGTDLGLTLFAGLPVTADDIAREHAGAGFGVLMTRNVATGATVALRRTLLDRALPIPAEWLHDEWLAVVAAATDGLDVIEEALLGYRQHDDNVIGVVAISRARKWRKLLERRGDRNARLAARAAVLVARLEAMPDVAPHVLRAARGKLLHERRRESLPSARPLRVAPVIAEWASGRYRIYGRGGADLLRDFVQPD